jgi:L-alanine-DL-glutamate epimerase-like enolase superfamily enzyme
MAPDQHPVPKATDIRLREVKLSWQTYRFRTPIKFGGRTGTHTTLLNVECGVETRTGRFARGFGSMPMGNTWSYPSAVMDYDQTLGAMKALAERCARLTENHSDFGHPIDLGVHLEERFLAAAQETSAALGLPQPIPKLATLVTGSAFDAAIHDGFGKVHGVSCYQTYDRAFMSRDLGAYLGTPYEGKWLEDFVRREPVPQLPLYHLVGALDPLVAADVAKPVGDGLPETLAEWIPYNGLTHLKIKLNGDDLAWDLERVLAVHAVVTAAGSVAASQYSLDFNERCPHVDYLVEMLRKLRERAPQGFERVQYVEQPTARDLKANPHNRMHAAAALRPVVIDESLTDLDSLLLARDMGYTGAALKACKGQSQSLLMAAAAQTLGMFLCVQDLTCPGASLIQSASLAAHVPGVAGIEANSRQFCPAANHGWDTQFPAIFSVRHGVMDTSVLRGMGLGAVAPGASGPN